MMDREKARAWLNERLERARSRARNRETEIAMRTLLRDAQSEAEADLSSWDRVEGFLEEMQGAISAPATAPPDGAFRFTMMHTPLVEDLDTVGGYELSFACTMVAVVPRIVYDALAHGGNAGVLDRAQCPGCGAHVVTIQVVYRAKGDGDAPNATG